MKINKNKKFTEFDKIINDNILAVSSFFQTYIPDCKVGKTEAKIAVNCPLCDENRKRHKMVINLDWNNYRCFRCGESGSLFKFCKLFNIKNEFISLLSSLTSLSSFNILNLYKNSTVSGTIENDIEDESINNNEYIKEFIAKNGLFEISEMPTAYKYAMTRAFNNKLEVESYLADDKYIYIPIVTDDAVVSYMGRLYIDIDNYPRYIIHQLLEDKMNIGFYDNVISNISNNSVYITEGYFDSYAINHAMSNYVSVCAFGKSKVVSVAEKLAMDLPSNTKVYLTLDSIKKDNKIAKDNIKYGKKISKIFSDLYIIELPDSDPADILQTKGSLELKRVLKDYSMPFIKYCIKYAFK